MDGYFDRQSSHVVDRESPYQYASGASHNGWTVAQVCTIHQGSLAKEAEGN